MLKNVIIIMAIDITDCAMDDKLLKELTDILSNANGKLQVQNLFLQPTKLSGIQSLETAIRARVLVNMKWLFLSNTLTDDADVNGALLTTLLQSIAFHCSGVRLLDLSSNSLGLPGLCSVVENIPFGLDDIELTCTHHVTTSELYTVTREMLTPIPNSLITMHFNGSNFSGTAGTLLLAKLLQAFQSLEDLDCSDCSLTSADIIMLIHHLKSANVICKNINILYLSLNSIDDEGVIALTECLPELFPSLDNFEQLRMSSQGGDVLLHGNPVSKEVIQTNS